MRNRIIVVILVSLAFCGELQAKFVFFGWGDEKIIKVMELPDNSDFTSADGDFIDLGYRYQQVTIFFIPIWNYNGKWCGYIGKDDYYWNLSKEDFLPYLSHYGLPMPDKPNIPFWDEIGGKLLMGFLLIGYIYFSYFAKKDENENVIDAVEDNGGELEKIERLASLKEKGHISESEFEKKKNELL